MKAGKTLEHLVVAIQEYIKDNSDAQIISNAKLKDNAGLDREIDVLVRTKAQGGIIGVAFECKDYQDKVDVKEVEAFNSKTLDIPGIHKRIIVSSNGYTSGAKTKARYYGIELYQLGEVPLNQILNPFDIIYTQCWVEMERCYQVIVTDDNNPALYSDNGVYSCADDKEIEILTYMAVILRQYMPSLFAPIHNDFRSKGQKQGDVQLIITPPDKMYVLDIQGVKHIVKELYVTVRVTLSESPQEVAKQSLYSGMTEDTQPVRISEYTRDEGVNLLLVHGEDNKYMAFVKDKEGNLQATHLVRLKNPVNLRDSSCN